ncbi:MAG: helix-turn-helix domain-containing protein [Bacteroidales bacterium]|jgi:transcriptional regulator with XRE-family HTH domain|nr:helix-turn-helix domain-containing protein [Bacteroidales bacterium]MCK9498722.1 helix-turn-helix domain-containing protein [Bacteroidales bacterium]MDY0313805.1 helix-turn-helix domain-containing protein [Bacteroidales bacterium]NLB85839.1 helix-turn-helix domain-containing protein [Bacteroidales bacterium]
MFLSSNLKHLRKRKKRTQDDVAKAVNLPRPTYSGYENSVASPSIETLINLSNYFNFSVDNLLKLDLAKMPESQLRLLEAGNDIYIKGGNLRVLHGTVDDKNNENIELVNLKAKAGYTQGFADPEFVKVLPVFKLPFLSSNKKYRTFQISGDSMLPIPDGSYVTGEFIQNWFSLKDGDACIILSLDDGIVFKCIENKLQSQKKLGLYSLNPDYSPYTIDVADIKEIWRFVNYISAEMPDSLNDNSKIHQQIANLNDKIDLLVNKIEMI